MRCPHCNHKNEHRVVRTQKFPHFIRRERLCSHCRKSFVTIEQPQQ